MSEHTFRLRPSSPLISGFLRLAHDEDMSRWLMEDPSRFAAFYAALSARITWPEELVRALPGKGATGRITLNDKGFNAWKRRGDHPFMGRISPMYLQSFWVGLQCHELVSTRPAVWQEALRHLATQFPLERAPSDAEEVAVLKPETAVGLKTPSSALPDRNALTVFGLNLSLLLPFVDLSPIEQEVLEFAFLLAEDESVRLLFDLVAMDTRHLLSAFPALFGVSYGAWERLSSPDGVLSRSRLVSFHPQTRRVLPMSEFWHGWFTSLVTSVADLYGKLVVPLTSKQNSGALARVKDEDADVLERIFAVPRWSDDARKGINVLLYGSRSIDKIGWVANRVESWGKTAYTLARDIPDADMASVCYFAQRYVDRLDSRGILVIPQADSVLTRTHRGQRTFLFLSIEVDDETHDNESDRALIEDSSTLTIWLTHAADRLSEENVGRFLYVCEMRGASRADRRGEVLHALKDMGFPDEFHAELAQHTQLGSRQLENSARLARLLHPEGLATTDAQRVRAARQDLVRHAVEQGQKALGRHQREVLRRPITQYSLDYLNTSGAFSIQQIIQSLQQRPSGTLCFWGIPGTGKTQLAEYIAVAIDKPLIVKRASDILGMYVGENEKHIRAMFREAADEDAMLLLDEADTFLRDRRYARQGWEVSMVNELLQGMERFQGVFVCATNLFDCLDAAALRRFTFKVQFRALTAEQAWRMFVNETGMDTSGLSEKEIENWKTELVLLRDLTPGDFATVQRTRKLLNVTLSPEAWFRALKDEVDTKMRAANAEQRILMGGPHTAFPD